MLGLSVAAWQAWISAVGLVVISVQLLFLKNQLSDARTTTVLDHDRRCKQATVEAFASAQREHLEGLRQLVLKGEFVAEDGNLVFKVTEFVTANGRAGTDQMPHAGAPLHMFAFYRLGRRKAKEYLANRAQPWPPIPFAEIGRKVLAEDDPPVEDA